jgi:hypothetical protein
MEIERNRKKSVSLPKKGPLPRIEFRFELNFLATRK